MKKQSTFWIVIIILLVIVSGAAVYFGKNETQKGSFTLIPAKIPPIKQQPIDLVVEAITATPGSGTIEVGFKDLVKNLPCTPVIKFRARFYLKYSNRYYPNGYIDQTVSHNRNNNASCYLENGNWEVGPDIKIPLPNELDLSGRLHRAYGSVAVTINPDNSIPETNTSNNTLTMNFPDDLYYYVDRSGSKSMSLPQDIRANVR